jgi:nitroimidazol reductase NimA-like FMN-containing flavoprotein (pyridoxamine 5'-phosphate oxidase superfamily)
MGDHSRLHEIIQELCVLQKFGVLATQSDDLQPYCNFIAFSTSDDFSKLFFITPKNTRKYRNLKKNKKVSFLLDSRLNAAEDFETAVAATAFGSASEIDDASEVSCLERHIEKHPSIETFIRSSDCALFRIDVQKYIIAESLEKVFELKIG